MKISSESLYVTQVRFCRALAVVRSLPTESGGAFQPSVADKLNFYGLYKQTLVGDCMLLKPSSRNVVQYAKWKSWDRLRGVSPIDAQTMYIHALIDLLQEFLRKYPDSELTKSLTESLNYLQEVEDSSFQDDENLVHWDTNEGEKEEYYLGQIEQEQLINEQQPSYYSSPITSEFPMTPELSPRQTKQHYSKSPQHYLYHPPISAVQREMNDDEDYLDNEVATATSSLYLSTPSQNPYNKHNENNSSSGKKKRSSSASSSKALRSLQTEVAALCEEIDHLRKRNSQKHRKSRIITFRLLWFFKSVAKHAFFNFLILMLLFLVLWRRKSPIAYAVISYAGPRLKDLLHYISSHVVFWKVTV